MREYVIQLDTIANLIKIYLANDTAPPFDG